MGPAGAASRVRSKRPHGLCQARCQRDLRRPDAVAAIVRGVGSDEAVCSAIVNWGANPVGTRVLRLRQTLAAGGSQGGIVSQMPAVADGSTTQNAVRLVRLQPGDRVELLGFQTSGFTIEVFPLDFGAAWIGP